MATTWWTAERRRLLQAILRRLVELDESGEVGPLVLLPESEEE